MEITICCYNIHSGKNIFYWPTLKKMIDFFRERKVDILALQEVHNNSTKGWQFNIIQDSLGMAGSYGGNLPLGDGHYGNATFSRFPIIHSQNTILPSEKEPRGALSTTLLIDDYPVQLINTHLGLGRKERTIQMNQIEQLLSADQPNLLVGDFNTTAPHSFPLDDLGKRAGKEDKPTIFPLKKRIDFIFASSSFELIDYEVLEMELSDHYPVVASLRLLQ